MPISIEYKKYVQWKQCAIPASFICTILDHSSSLKFSYAFIHPGLCCINGKVPLRCSWMVQAVCVQSIYNLLLHSFVICDDCYNGMCHTHAQFIIIFMNLMISHTDMLVWASHINWYSRLNGNYTMFRYPH